ncbi:MAG TPA: trigger factor [Mogibacterium sp.]|nr:trigger factor [Mogibacterium sp.]
MKATQVSKENGVAKFKIEFSQEEFKEALNKAYLENREKFSIDGFRKGKAPRKVIESHYGKDIFYDEALNALLEKNYFDAIKEMELDVIAQPLIESPVVNTDQPIEIVGSVEVFPEIEVKNYKGLELEKFDTRIGDAEVEEELKNVQRKQARMETVENRKSEDGDTVIIDFEGSVDGEVFEGGTAENHELKLGSGQFIPGFEEQLVGKEAGEEVDVTVTFPEEYHAENLAGKEAVFKCKLHEIKTEILPEIDDELASDVSEFETLEEYKKDIQEKLQKEATDRDVAMMKDRAIEKLYNENNIEAPQVMVKNELDNMIYDMNQNLASQGLSLKQYMEWMGKTVDEVKEDARPEAEKRIKTRILLKNIIRIENLTVSDEEVNQMLKKFADQYGMTEEQVTEMAGAETLSYFKEDALTKKAVDLIYDNANFVEVEVIDLDKQ